MTEKRVNRIALVYTGISLLVYATINYTRPYDSTSVDRLVPWQFGMWITLYVPLLVFPFIPSWQVREFGFAVNKRAVWLAIICAILCYPAARSAQISIQSAAIEAFARTGEEIFFRGFLYLLVYRLAKTKTRPWLWSVIISALLFALIHTQNFQDDFNFQAINAVFQVFLVSIAFAATRAWSGSILPGIVMHTAINQDGLVSVLFGFVIYIVITVWAYYRGENIIPGDIHLQRIEG